MSGPTSDWARSTSTAGFVASSASTRSRGARREGSSGRRPRHPWELRLRARGRTPPPRRRTRGRGWDRHDRLELCEVPRHERVGGGDRRVGDAGDHRAEAEERVIDAIAGEDRDWPLDAQLSVDQGLRNVARGAPSLGVGQFAPRLPAAHAFALGKEHPLRRDLGPMIEPVGRGAGVGAERMGRARQHNPVRPALDDHLGRTERQLRPRRHPFLPFGAVFNRSKAGVNSMSEDGRGPGPVRAEGRSATRPPERKLRWKIIQPSG